MRKRFLLISTILVLSAFTFAACGKKSPSSPEANSETTEEKASTKASTTEEPSTEKNTESKDSKKEEPVATTEEPTTEATKEPTTATKKDEQAKPKTATGTYNGFADTNSVEIEMSDGSYQTFLVNDDDVKTALNKKGEGSKITFTYGAVEGQANKEILSIK